MKKNILFIFICLLLLNFSSCNKIPDDQNDPPINTKFNWSLKDTYVEVNHSTLIILENHSIDDYIITTSPENIVTIDKYNIYGNNIGTAIITLTDKNNPNIFVSQQLDVIEPKPLITTEDTLMVNGLYDLKINNNTDFSDYLITFSNDAATIFENYLLCKKIGTVTMTVTSKKDNRSFSIVELNIAENTSTNVQPVFNINKTYCEIGNNILLRLTNYSSLQNFDIITKFYDEDNQALVYIKNTNRIVGVNPCNQELYIRLKDDHSCTAKLNYEITTLCPELYYSRNCILVNESVYLDITNLSETYESSINDFIWSVSDENVASVENCILTAKKPGKINISVVSKYNSLVSSTINLNIYENNDNENNLVINVVETYNGSTNTGNDYTFTLYNTKLQSECNLDLYNFVVSNDEIIRITDSGTITCISEGFASVSAYRIDNPTEKATFNFHIDGIGDIDYVAKFLNVALKEKGYVERYDPEKDEYVNDTKYNHWYNMDGAWCAMFVSWCWYYSGLSNDLLLKYCNCVVGQDWCIAQGIYSFKEKYQPKSGDIIFFLSSGSSHTGIVVYSDDKYVYTIEGNASNRVDCWRWSKNDARITGYASPLYPEYSGEKTDFSWIVNSKINDDYWWNEVPEKQPMI